MDINRKIIDWLEYGGLALFVLTLPLLEGPKNIGFGLAAIGFILRRIMMREFKVRWYPFGIGLLLFFISSLVSSFFAQDISLSLKGAWDIFRIGFIFLIIANDMTAWKKEIVMGLIFSISIGAAWGIYNTYVYDKNFLEILSLGHFNHTGIYLAMMLAIIVSLLIFDHSMPSYIKICLFISAALVLIALVLTSSRGSFVGLLAALASMAVIRGGWKGWVVIAGIVFVFVVLALQSDGFREKGLSSSSMRIRIEIWKNGYQAFRENPIVGVGMNHFGKIDFERYKSSQNGIAPHAHSLYVNVAVQNGLFGIIALFSVLGGFLKTWWMTKDTATDDFDRAVICGGFGVFCIVVVSGVFNTTFHHEHGILFSIAAALFVNNGKEQ